MRWTRRPFATKLIYTLIGLALGAIGIGWHGRPPDEVMIEAVRARSPAHALATIKLDDVTRNWVHEIFGTSTSQFMVTATIAPREGLQSPVATAWCQAWREPRSRLDPTPTGDANFRSERPTQYGIGAPFFEFG